LLLFWAFYPKLLAIVVTC